MQTHGKAPKFVLVKRYARWQRGTRKAMESCFRGLTPKLSMRQSPKQLKLGI